MQQAVFIVGYSVCELNDNVNCEQDSRELHLSLDRIQVNKWMYVREDIVLWIADCEILLSNMFMPTETSFHEKTTANIYIYIYIACRGNNLQEMQTFQSHRL